jgi:CheY-like chemotaxis protein
MATTRSGRILVVDNDPDFRDSVEILLSSRGYTVFATSTRLEAMQLAVKERVHVAVLDIRMESDPDHDDTSGLTLAKQLDPLIVKIMVTGYLNVPVVRNSYGEAAAFAVVGKDELPNGLLEALKQAFTEEVGLNFDLSIRWQGLQPEEVAQCLELAGRPTQAVIQSEIEEVLGKLVTPLIPSEQVRAAPQSGAVVIKVQPSYQGGWAAPVVVKLAAREMIEVEAGNYKQHVERYLNGFRHTLLQDKSLTHLLGGIIYSLVGTPLEECVDLGTFYATHSAAEVLKALYNLFTKTCRHWYENREPQQDYDLIRLYAKPLKLSVIRMETALRGAGMPDWVDSQPLSIPDLKRPITNPVKWLRQHPSLIAQVSLARTHGDMHSQNVLLDPNQQAWLIDFYRSGPGHLFRDLIELESDIKFVLLDVTDLPTLLQFESALLSAKFFSDKPTLPTFRQAELRKAFEVVQGIRHIAGELIGPRTSMLDYYQGLLLQTLAMIGRRHIGPLKKRHAYLAASLLCQRLDHW